MTSPATKMFKSKNDFSLHIEQIKNKMEFETYIETVIYFYENETDQEMEDIAKLLNKKLIDCIEREGVSVKMIKSYNLEPII